MSKRALLSACIAMLLCVALAVGVVAAEPGQRVKSFGHNGWLVVEGLPADALSDLVVQPNGKTVALLDANNVFHVMRFTRDGSFDPKFNFSGTARTEFANDVAGEAVAVQEDGKIIVAGGSSVDDAMVLARYMPNGRLDKSFSKNGKLTLKMEEPPQSPVWAYAVAVQANGKIVVAGTAETTPGQYDYVATRLGPKGGLDASYGDGGWRVLNLGGIERPQDLVLHSGDAYIVGYTEIAANFDIALARLNNEGDPHSEWGPGYKVHNLGVTETALVGAIAKNGNLLIGGDKGGAADRDMMVARFTQEGFLDGGFAGSQGYETVPAANGARGIAVQGDGKIILSGSGNTGAKNELFLVRFRGNGVLDLTWNDDGILTTSPKNSGIVAPRMGMDNDNQLVVGGWHNYSPSQVDFVFGRFHTGLPKN